MAEDAADREHMERDILLVCKQSTAVNDGEGQKSGLAHL